MGGVGGFIYEREGGGVFGLGAELGLEWDTEGSALVGDLVGSGTVDEIEVGEEGVILEVEVIFVVGEFDFVDDTADVGACV